MPSEDGTYFFLRQRSLCARDSDTLSRVSAEGVVFATDKDFNGHPGGRRFAGTSEPLQPAEAQTPCH